MNRNDYYDNNGIGLFTKWFKEQEMEIEDIDEELQDDNAADCIYLEFDDNFPLKEKIDDENKKNKEIFEIIQYCYKHAIPPRISQKDISAQETAKNKFSKDRPNEQKEEKDDLDLIVSYYARNSSVKDVPSDICLLIYEYASYASEKLKKTCKGLGIYYFQMEKKYYDKCNLGLFTKWFRDNKIIIRNLKKELNGKYSKRCKCLNFDEDEFPLSDSVKKNEKEEKFKIIQHCYKHGIPPANKILLMNERLGDYYALCERMDYYNENGIGKFLRFCVENGFDDGDIKDEFKSDDFNSSFLIDFDEKFPIPKECLNQNEKETIFQILKNIYKGFNALKDIQNRNKSSLFDIATALSKWNRACDTSIEYKRQIEEALKECKKDFDEINEMALLNVLSQNPPLKQLLLLEKLTRYLPVFLEMYYSHFVWSNEILYDSNRKQCEKSIENFLKHSKLKVLKKYKANYVDIFEMIKNALLHPKRLPVPLMRLPQPTYLIATPPSKVFGIMADFFDVYKELREEYKNDRMCITVCVTVEAAEAPCDPIDTDDDYDDFKEDGGEEKKGDSKIKNLVRKIIKYRKKHKKLYVSGILQRKEETDLKEVKSRLVQSSNDILPEDYKSFLSSLGETMFSNKNFSQDAQNQKNASQKNIKERIKEDIKKLWPENSRIVIVLDRDLKYVMFKPEEHKIPETYMLGYNYHMLMEDYIRYGEKRYEVITTRAPQFYGKLFAMQFDKSVIDQILIYCNRQFTHFHGSGIDNMVKRLFHKNASDSSVAPQNKNLFKPLYQSVDIDPQSLINNTENPQCDKWSFSSSPKTTNTNSKTISSVASLQ